MSLYQEVIFIGCFFVPSQTLRLFAVRLLRDLLVAVLRQEGHAFCGVTKHATLTQAH